MPQSGNIKISLSACFILHHHSHPPKIHDSTINFAPKLDGKIKLGSTLIINKIVIINGPSSRAITISGDDKVGVFYVSSGIKFRIINLTIAQGRVKGEPGSSGKPGQPGSTGTAAKGGGLYNDGGTVTILNCTFLDNGAMGVSGGRGGFGGVVLPKRTAPGPGGKGGDGMGSGLYNTGTVFLVNSTFSGNSAMGGRGGISVWTQSKSGGHLNGRCRP